MRVLLDTHVLLWAALNEGNLTSRAQRIFEEPHDICVSIVAAWEIVIKAASGRLKLPLPPVEFVDRQIADMKLIELPIERNHLRELSVLPQHHRDPFDRMLVAQARAEKIPILSADGALARYDVELIW